MRYLSVCSGIEAATVAWHPLGWEAAAYSEIEAFPRAVLAHHYPDTPCHGNFTTIGSDEYGPIDLLVGGTPCQSFSIAGLRGGLADDRGNLALEFLRLAQRTRAEWLVWENVPGVLSSNGGRDFGAILGGLVELGYGFAYRVLDAQHFGVPQRRRRVFVVGHLGDWRRAAAVLFERHSLSGHPAPRRQAGQGVAGTIKACAGKSGTPNGAEEADRLVVASTGETSHCLNAGGMGRQDYETETLIAHSLRGEGFDAGEDGTGRGTPIIPIDMRQASRGATMTNNRSEGSSGGAPGTGIGDPGDPSPTISTSHTPAIAYAIQERAVSENLDAGPGGKGWAEGSAYTLESRNKVQAVAFNLRGREDGAQPEADPDNLAAMRAASGGSSRSYIAFAENSRAELRLEGGDGQRCGALSTGGGKPGQGVPMVASSAVRRLTPRECERLQGFPDDYTLVPYRNKPAADGPRYKALGNSFAVPVVRWLGERIQLVHSLPVEALHAA